MARQVIFVILLLLFVLNPQGQYKRDFGKYKSVYNYAEQLFSSASATDKTDSLATLAYHKVILLLTRSADNDSVLFDSYVKAGIIEMIHQQNARSLQDFISSINFAKNRKSIADSSLFKPYLYTGSIYYSLFDFDSALHYYRQAEVIVNKYPAINESERLYNKLGVLFFETGDYKKSILYFEKALSLLESQKAPSAFFIVTYKNNIASALRKLRRYNEALSIYRSLLPYHFNTKELLYNIGVTHLDAGDAKQAIQYLQQVEYNNQLKYNDLARANIMLHHDDSAAYFLQRAFALQPSATLSRKNPDFGITLKYQADLLFAKHETHHALEKYQQSIIQIDPDFSDASVSHNPNTFYGLHNSFLLFEVLQAKARSFVQLFFATENTEYLGNAFNTYLSALSLAGHVIRMYHSDESKIFLEQNVSAAYKEAVKTGLQLFELTKSKMYLEKAFSLAENSKASVLQTDLHDLELNGISGLSEGLVKEQNTLKASLSNLYMQQSQTKDSMALQKIQTSLRDQEIRLSSLQDKLDEEPSYYQLKFNSQEINVDSIQQKILTKDEAIVSYYYYDNKLVCFYITKEKSGYSTTLVNKDLFNNISIFRKQLNAAGEADRKMISAISGDLYKQLIEPVRGYINNKKRLLIIPYNELSYLPFEALIKQNENKPLLYQFAISYQYSANFLSPPKHAYSSYEALVLAPFSAASNAGLSKLAFSTQEVAGLQGKILMDKEATKQQFFSFYNQYPVVHLATHAVVNDSTPLQSYIEFYADHSGNDTSHRLYEEEIYHLNMKKAQLVILSACETGNGQLINEEGIISLSRAFSYAGCKSVITSLWKADDAATAFIIKRMHFYLQKGFLKDEALQKAKINYLEDNTVDVRFKTPAYWAHLVLIGDNSSIVSRFYSIHLITAIALITAVIVLIRKSRTKKLHGSHT